MVKSDVVGVYNINYLGIRPLTDQYGDVVGTYVQQVQSINLNGSIPDFYKSKTAGKNAKSALSKLIKHIKKNSPKNNHWPN